MPEDRVNKLEGAAGRKEEQLADILAGLGGALVAFSGGVDSTYLLDRALHVLGPEKVLAVTAASALQPAGEKEAAAALASRLGAAHLVISFAPLEIATIRDNMPERCYYCKKELFGRLWSLARDRSLPAILDGTNREDSADYRPGLKAARELGVRSPLLEAGLIKKEIRLLSRRRALPTWNRPAAACLASRFPYGERLEPGKLRRVERAERFLQGLGLGGAVRVRCHGPLARIEVSLPDVAPVLEYKKPIAAYFKQIGFLYVALDLEGFRTGSMNRALEDNLNG